MLFSPVGEAGFAGASDFEEAAGVLLSVAAFAVSAFLAAVESLSSPVPAARAIAGDAAMPNARIHSASTRIPFLLEFNFRTYRPAPARVQRSPWPTNPHARRPVAANPASTCILCGDGAGLTEMKSNTKSGSYFAPARRDTD